MKRGEIFILGGSVMLFLGLMSGCGPEESEPVDTVSEEVTWEIGETTVYGTVTRPDDNKTHPAILFIAGSGPTDRDWNSPLLPGTNGSGNSITVFKKIQ